MILLPINTWLRRALLLFIAVLLLIAPTAALAAQDPPESETPDPEATDGAAQEDPAADLNITSDSVLLIDANSGTVLHEHNPDAKVYPASTTKILSALVILESGKLEEEATVGTEVDEFSAASSLMDPRLDRGERIKVKDLLYGMMLVSGNDAANTAAVHVGGSLEGFADMMNAKAAELGLSDSSHFVTPSGVHDEEHYTTARDYALVARAAFQNQQFMEIVGTKSYKSESSSAVDERIMETTNKLISEKEDDAQFNYAYANGMKTGVTSMSGGCLVASATKDDRSLIALIFGDQTESEKYIARWGEARRLFEFGFNTYEGQNASELLSGIPLQVQIEDAAASDNNKGLLTLQAEIMPDATVSMSKQEMEAIQSKQLTITPEYRYDETAIVAPVEAGQLMGEVTFMLNEKELLTVPIVATRDVASISDATAYTPPAATGSLISQQANPRPTLILWLLVPILIVIILIIRALVKGKKDSFGPRRSGNARVSQFGKVRRRKNSYQYGRPNNRNSRKYF